MRIACTSRSADNGLCIGCGTCSAICPDKVLEMRFNRLGEYNPVETRACTRECGLCSTVCPFADGNPDEDEMGRLLFGEIPGIQHRSEVGYYLGTLVGHSQINDLRERGSSGGMATWILQTLLKEGAVDAVVCVTPNADPNILFRFAVFTTPEEVGAASGSAYYPVELSEVLRYIIEHPGRYAVTGLPCFVKAIRLAQLRNRNLRERIVVVLGLVCGQLKSRNYTAYIAALAGLDGEPTQVRFRGKDPNQPASNFYFSCQDQGGDERCIHWNDGVNEAWSNRWFTPTACNYCDDIFAECADVTFMDAWLPVYSHDPKGTSLVIVRSPPVRDMLQAGSDSGALVVSSLSIDDVMRSQEGVIEYKRRKLGERLSMARARGQWVPKKRVVLHQVGDPFRRWILSLDEAMQHASHCDFATAIENGSFVSDDYRRSMTRHLDRIRHARKISAGVMLSVRAVGRLRKYFHV